MTTRIQRRFFGAWSGEQVTIRKPDEEPSGVEFIMVAEEVMGALTAFYVRVSSPKARDALLAEHPSAFTEPGTDFFAVDNPPCGFEPPEEELRALSARLDTDVLWITFQSVVDAFEFHHWRKGNALRSLAFGCRSEERTWERVEGEPEPWEEVAFEDLQAPMEPGQWDGLDARESAREIAIHYRLPDWSDDWGPA